MGERARRDTPRLSFTAGLVIKLVLLALIDGLVLAALPRMIDQRTWVALAFSLVALFALNWIYLSTRRLPGKYLFPATVMLLLFSVYPVVYTIYVSFTNYSAAHNLSKDQAVARILANSEQPSPDSPRYRAVPLLNEASGRVGVLLTDPEERRFLGTVDGLTPLAPGDVQGQPPQVTVRGFRQLNLAEALRRQDQFLALRIPAEGGSIRLQTISQAAQAEQFLTYDRQADTITDSRTGARYRPVDGTFTADDGSMLTPGFQVVTGFDNYARIFTSSAIRGPFLRVFIWNYVFAFSTVLLQFGLGLLIALSLYHPRLRGRRVYRSLLVIPFALPSYLTSLIWAGLLNQQFGAVNRILGANIDWLRDPLTAKVSILLVTMWLGFPYFFLVSTGALTSIPEELTEAAAVDGASGWHSFRTVRFPLLLTALGPLLISSFAFNFNNFNAVYLLTQGGPPIQGAQTPAGHTDILITYTYRLAFESGRGANYALAAGVAVIIFLMILVITVYSFRFTRALEQAR